MGRIYSTARQCDWSCTVVAYYLCAVCGVKNRETPKLVHRFRFFFLLLLPPQHSAAATSTTTAAAAGDSSVEQNWRRRGLQAKKKQQPKGETTKRMAERTQKSKGKMSLPIIFFSLSPPAPEKGRVQVK